MVLVCYHFTGGALCDGDVLDFYQEPYISNFYPIRGPQSGGTRLTIVGDHMNTGTNRTATVAGRPCQIIP